MIPHLLRNCEVTGSCRGIICLITDTNPDCEDDIIHVYLWNPSIKMYKTLALFNIALYLRAMGFGYDSLSANYKVVVFYAHLPLTHIHDTNSNSWKVMYRTFYVSLVINVNYVSVNEVLYFDIGDELLSFNLHDEIFVRVTFLETVQTTTRLRKRSDVLDFNGSVAVVLDSDSGEVDLWTLDSVSSGSKVSWSRKFKILVDNYLRSYLGAGQFYGYDLLLGNDITQRGVNVFSIKWLLFLDFSSQLININDFVR